MLQGLPLRALFRSPGRAIFRCLRVVVATGLHGEGIPELRATGNACAGALVMGSGYGFWRLRSRWTKR